MFYALNNLADRTAVPCNPWEREVVYPEDTLKDKKIWLKWCQQPDTKGCHFSGFEGLDGLSRIVNPDNPPFKLHGFVVDYDAKITTDMMESIVRRCPSEMAPTWGSYTFSGGARLVWELEEPVLIPDNPSLQLAFLKIASKKLNLKKILPGWDEPAFYDPARYYEKGTDWTRLGGLQLSSNFPKAWLMKAGDNVNWKKSGHIEIPLNVVHAEINRRFPNRWNGRFEEGSRGIRFWDEDADNLTSAIVRPTGMQCFTGDTPFLSWSEILGDAFTKKYEADRLSDITEPYHTDGKVYWRYEDTQGTYLAESLEMMRLTFKTKDKLSTTISKKETCSEVDTATFHVQRHKRVDAALPYLYFPRGVISVGGGRILNTSTVKVMTPSTETDIDPEKHFPFLNQFLSNFFLDPCARDNFLSWTSHALKNAYKRTPVLGQAMFLAGAPGVGKTFMSNVVLSGLFGGHADATSYLMGDERFTAHVVKTPLMSIDDAAPATDMRKADIFTSQIKKIVANPHQHYEEKFRMAGLVEWLGRIIITLNLDPVSLRLLPSTDQSNKDKMTFIQVKDSGVDFPEKDVCKQIAAVELPFLSRWLLNYTIPEEQRGSSRFGVKAYHDKFLMASATQSGVSHTFYEMLIEFLEDWGINNPDANVWKGTSSALLGDMRGDARLGGLVSRHSPNQVSTYLGQLKSRGYQLERNRRGNIREWVIPLDIITQEIED